ncbi:hypothetical protein WOLCODRAFT_167388 [Wolfiporia cocos MD-104 SS10]|uniref:Uncharacterized protein n=1 Tax=Wolfiporia cocos (strain MD-104) TaxID=742152 RepID=A0A2H3JKN6_WOLCO|nr:hypothetical protein WOLCODRAFT_167388 [Wolfiporia cocos MD-104 SS10]
MVLQWDRDSASTVGLFEPSRLSAILVRDEYRCMLRDILDDVGLCREGAGRSKDDEDDAAMDMDAQTCYNPFVDLPDRAPGATGAIVMGSPGVGKSLFLVYVLTLRLLAGRTTTFQRDNKTVFILNDEGVFRISHPVYVDDDLHLYLPRGTWFLVDSNQELTNVPPIYLCLGSCRGLILQAASPRIRCVEWAKKAARLVSHFWMAPWSLGELIAGRDIQLWEPPSRKPSVSDLVLFSRLYGTSARHAYAYAAALDEYRRLVDGNIPVLTRENMARILGGFYCANMDDTMSHAIFVATPSPRTRDDFDLQIATVHLLRAVLDQLSRANDQAADMLYQVFIGTYYTRTCAGYLLEGAFLVKFPDGGEWPVTAMEKNTRAGAKYMHWRCNGTYPPTQYLRLGFQGRIVAIKDNHVDAAAKFKRLDRHYFSLQEKLTLKDGFYVPRSKSQPTFDAFIYDAGARRATVFLVTVFDRHAISTHALDWLLHACGVESVDLVVVTPPWADKLGNLYHLGLHDLMGCTAAELKTTQSEALNMGESEMVKTGESGKPRVGSRRS